MNTNKNELPDGPSPKSSGGIQQPEESEQPDHVEPCRKNWPHRWAWLLACATFPLIWVGGLITTTNAGMAVPDWPGTYGYNMFLYPLETWFFGPWDLFIEHGHRLFASGVGMITIGLLIVIWRCDDRRWLQQLAVVALGMVILQGVLGGLRVDLNERYIAMAHGSIGPLFFALTAALVVLTAKRTPSQTEATVATPPRWLIYTLPAVLYCQLLLGASMRHAPEEGGFHTFTSHVRYHLVFATIALILVIWNSVSVWRLGVTGGLRKLALAMALGIGVQVCLGIGTWMLKYHVPQWAQAESLRPAWAAVGGSGTMPATIAGGWTETHTVTAHSATGSLLLGLSVASATLAVQLSPRKSRPD